MISDHKTPTFAFIVHSRNRSDMARKFPFLKFLPDFVLDFITLNAPPFVVSKITGLEDEGMVIGVPMTAHQLLEHRELASRKIVRACKLARSRGARFIGLGAMTASLSRSGKDVIEQVPDVCVTTGRTYTAKNISDYVDWSMNKFSLDKDKLKIAIVGAAGGIGSSTLTVLAHRGYKNFLLIDLERKLERIKKRTDLSIEISHQVSRVSEADIIIAATSAPEVVIESQDVNPGTIIINDAQPSDISPEILHNREDVLVIEGGVLSTPNINCHLNMGLAHKNDIFSCLAETLLLNHMKSDKHFSIDDFDHGLFGKLENSARELGFSIQTPQNDLGYISEQQLEKFAKIVTARYV